MPRLRLVSTLIAVLTAATCLAAPVAHAGGRFAKPRVTYRDKSTFGSAVAEAVRMWNAAGTPVKLVKATGRNPANITITTRQSLRGDGGRTVAGRGGGMDFGKRRASGFVWLSASVLADKTEALRVNVAAHELGHALGLGHDRDPCTLMSPFADNVAQSVCPAGAGLYRCGPQARDAQTLAKLYRGKARFPAGAGVCALPQAKIEFLGPAEVTTASFSPVEIVARNGGPATWGQFAMAIGLTDAAGNEINSPCTGDSRMRGTMLEESVAPGQTATFSLTVCGPSGTTQDFHVRLLDDTSDPGRPFPVGPVHTFRVTFT